MKLSALTSALALTAVVKAQRSFISSPSEGTDVTRGSQIVVQVVRPNSIQGSIEVGMVIGLQSCPVTNPYPCAPPQQQVGSVLFSGQFNPVLHEQPGRPYENFTVMIPDTDYFSGRAQLSVDRFHLIGVRRHLFTNTGLVSAAFQPSGLPFKSPVTLANGFAAHVLFSNLTTPRGIAFDSEQNLLVVERGFGVTAFTRVTSPSSGFERTVVVQNPDVTHGILVVGKLLYVSTAVSVIAYPYDPSAKTVGTPYVAVEGLPGDGGPFALILSDASLLISEHKELTTHTLLYEDHTGAFLIGSGPLDNIDPTARDPASGRSQIRRLVPPPVSTPVDPPAPLQWSTGQVIAFGIRNPGGFAFDVAPTSSSATTRRLYVVENGASIDNVTGLTAQFVNDNPSDELEFVQYSDHSQPSSFGFPDCVPLWNPTADPVGVPQYVGLSRGTQVSLNLDAAFDDAWCQDTANNKPPVLNFQVGKITRLISGERILTCHVLIPFRLIQFHLTSNSILQDRHLQLRLSRSPYVAMRSYPSTDLLIVHLPLVTGLSGEHQYSRA
ncbi:hypothetical protein H0H87_000416 [Tephrocybe sp. NHM501043]|nr:hypothetical protein H0H87_000416 [Tephrocybe sp. NHM501043]